MARILIVDDTSYNLDLLGLILEGANHQITKASCGKQAIALSTQDEFDLVLLDIIMPDINGIEVCKRLKANPDFEHIPIIMVSALENDKSIVEALDYGAHDFISKPYDVDILTARVRSALRLKQSHDLLQETNKKLHKLATTDTLTGLNNRRHFFELSEQEISRTRRYNNQLSMIMLDADHFKHINDSYGHAAGDETLIHIANILKETCRNFDIIGRVGGEEFAICCPEASQENILNISERIRKNIEDNTISFGSKSFNVTVSIGITTLLNTDSNISDLLNRADHALYHAKKAGRNQVSQFNHK